MPLGGTLEHQKAEQGIFSVAGKAWSQGMGIAFSIETPFPRKPQSGSLHPVTVYQDGCKASTQHLKNRVIGEQQDLRGPCVARSLSEAVRPLRDTGWSWNNLTAAVS